MEHSKTKRDTKTVGDISEVTVMSALIRMGYRVAIPYGENHRYDFLFESEGQFKRVQVKTGRLRLGAILFNAYSSHAHRNGGPRSYRGDADFFGIYCPEIQRVLLVPVEDVAEQAGCLRWEPAKNNMTRKIRWADPYVLPVEPVQLVVGLEMVGGVSSASA